MLTTLQDVMNQLVDWLGDTNSVKAQRDAKRAMLQAYRQIASAAHWNYYFSLSKLHTNGAYETGTIAYDHTGGANPRQVTLTDGTWPEWAAFGVLNIGNQAYEVAERISDTLLTLAYGSNPGEDVDAETTYILFRDTYPMPTDFVTADQFVSSISLTEPGYIHPGRWGNARTSLPFVGQPTAYTFMGDTRYQGTMSCRFHPAPMQDEMYEFVYLRRPRPMQTADYKTGTLTVGADSASVTGSGTVWTEDMEGAVIRLAANSRDYPTGFEGANPFSIERVITEVSSATALTIDEIAGTAHTAVKYVISDPLDMEEGVLLNAFLACSMMHLGRARSRDDYADLVSAYQRELTLAREADCRTALIPRRSGAGRFRGLPMREFPVGPTVE